MRVGRRVLVHVSLGGERGGLCAADSSYGIGMVKECGVEGRTVC
jgi:hypothetical protein